MVGEEVCKDCFPLLFSSPLFLKAQHPVELRLAFLYWCSNPSIFFQICHECSLIIFKIIENIKEYCIASIFPYLIPKINRKLYFILVNKNEICLFAHTYILGFHDGETQVNWVSNFKILFCEILSKVNILSVDSYLSVYLSTKFK